MAKLELILLLLLPASLIAAPSVTRLSTGDRVAGKALHGEAQAFAPGQTVFAHVQLSNDRAGEFVRVVWLHAGEIRKRSRLKIGKSPRWRTWSKRPMKRVDTGSWRVDVTDREGALLASHTFEVRAPEVEPPTTTAALSEATPNNKRLNTTPNARRPASHVPLSNLPPKIQSLLRSK